MRFFRSLFKLIIFLVLVAVAGVVVAFQIRTEMHTPHQHEATSEIIVIEPGMSKKAIVNRLVEHGILANRWPTLIYLAVRPQAGRLQAGDYRFESPISPLSVLEKMERGLIATEQITIPEGYDHFDIIDTLVAAKIDTREAFEQAIKDTSLIADIDPEAHDLEGYLFPDTYVYNHQTHAPQLIAAMVKRCRQVLTPERLQRAHEMGMSVRELMTLSSLIEREAKVDGDRPLISAVFHNRLKRNMKLDCDPTFIYAAKIVGSWDNNVNNPLHRKRESPYNTYYSVGLPPGPIASPGVKSIDAALYPADADYLYFVVQGTDGHHKFSRTESEHLAAVAAYHRLQHQANN